MKRAIFVFGLVGLIGCFLPLVAGVSLFDLRHLGHAWKIWVVLGAFAVPTYVGLAPSEGNRVAGIAAMASFAYLAIKFGTGVFDLLVHASIGGIMMGVGIIGGLAASLLTLAASSKR